MQFINKQNDLAVTVLHFFQNGFQTLFKFSSVFCSCNQSSHIQCKNRLIFQSLRNISADDPLCQPFYGCRFTDTRLSDQDRIVLCLTRQDPDHISNLFVTSNDRIQLLISCPLHQILSIFV